VPGSRLARVVVAAALLAGGLTPALLDTGAVTAGAAGCPWMDKHKSADERAHELVKAMTLDQKIAELYGRGDLTYYGAANDIPAVPALCIPELVFNDAGAGVGDGQTGTTAFPDGIAQAASWDRNTECAVAAEVGRQAWEKSIDVQLAPGVDIARSPLNGRNFEYAGEDPYLSGQTGVAEIQGIQSQHVVATVKHYALNDQETNRMTDSSDADERTMEEIHLPAYEAAVRQGHVGSVMCSYNRINGTYACENRYLLRHVLDQQFGFKGWVMSDWGGTHSTVKAANSGLDQEQNISSGTYFNGALKTAVQKHQVPMSRLNDMVFRLMRSLFAVGVFDDPPPAEPGTSKSDVDTPEAKAIALAAAEGGAVLLKNANSALPIAGSGKTIAVIGNAVDPTQAQNYFQGGGSSRVPIAGPNPNVIDPLQGITSRAGADGDTVTYNDASSTQSAAAAASAADLAIVIEGDSTSEGVDRQSLSMSNRQCTLFGCTPSSGPAPDDVISAVAAANPNTIVVLQTGYPITMPWLSKVKAVLETWYPGEQEGTAIASLLWGDVNPSGHLPYTFPKKLSDSSIRTKAQYAGVPDQSGVPHTKYTEKLLVGYRWYDAKHIQPLFPFGFGLSYTTFRYSGLHVRPTPSGATVTFTVTNTGARGGADVAQLYVFDPKSAQEPPKQLKGFAKVFLQPGQSQTVTLSLDKRSFSYWNVKKHAGRVAAGCYGVGVGDSSRALPLHGRLPRAGGSCGSSR